MAWYRDSELVQNVSNVTNPNVDVWSSYTLTAAVPTLPSYECLTFFGELVPSSDEPVNLSRSIPSYNYSWSSVNQTVYCEWQFAQLRLCNFCCVASRFLAARPQSIRLL